MWGTNLTPTLTGQGQAAIFVAVDHGSTACVGLHAACRATRFEALEPIRQGGREPMGWMVPAYGSRGPGVRTTTLGETHR